MADTIKIGNLEIDGFKVGSDNCKIYLGDTLLYPQKESYPFAFRRITAGGSAYTRNCSSSSADTITSAMTISATSMSTISGTTSNRITDIIVGDCTTSIGTRAFSGWTKVSSVTISDDVSIIGDRAFELVGYHSETTRIDLKIGNGVTTIGQNAFNNCRYVNNIAIPSSVTTMSANCFSNIPGLTGLTFENGFNFVNAGQSIFSYCGIKNLTFPTSVTNIPYRAFYSCTNLSALTIPNSVISIGNEAFYSNNSLTSVTIPDSVTTVGTSAFTTTSGGLVNVDIGSGITSIGQAAFWSNRRLTRVICMATTPPTLASGTIPFPTWSSDDINYPLIYVPDGSVNTYKSSWGITLASHIYPISDLE